MRDRRLGVSAARGVEVRRVVGGEEVEALDALHLPHVSCYAPHTYTRFFPRPTHTFPTHTGGRRVVGGEEVEALDALHLPRKVKDLGVRVEGEKWTE